MEIKLTTEQQELYDKLMRETGGGKAKAVSFRMSGTLVIFPFAQYEDIFAFMEEDFADCYHGKGSFTELRMNAEDEASKKNTAKCSIGIEQIYDVLMKHTKISFEVCKKLMERECELAEYFAMPRGIGKKLFDEARRKGRKTVIVADTIYPQNTTENILKKCGYPCGNVLYTRDIDNGISPKEAIFAAILEKGHVSAEKLLSIGGNIEADVELPIMKGAKALFLTNVNQLMVKSGRLRGYIQAKIVLDQSPADHIALRCAMGLCSAYLFDVPLHKQVHSDFCSDPYILGFTVWGCLHLIKAYRPDDEFRQQLISGFAANDEITRGMRDFLEVFEKHFGDLLVKYGYKDCDLPLCFLEEHSASGDRELLSAQLSQEFMDEWASKSTDPSLAPVTEHKVKRSATAKLADKLFPPGTRVRNIADGMMVKLKSRGKL